MVFLCQQLNLLCFLTVIRLVELWFQFFYQLSPGPERYTEVLLLTNATPALIEKVKALASADGFHSFRVATIDLNVAPDFRKVINSGK